MTLYGRLIDNDSGCYLECANHAGNGAIAALVNIFLWTIVGVIACGFHKAVQENAPTPAGRETTNEIQTAELETTNKVKETTTKSGAFDVEIGEEEC